MTTSTSTRTRPRRKTADLPPEAAEGKADESAAATEPVTEPDADLPAEHDDVWARLAAPFADDEVELLPKPFDKNARKGDCTERSKDRNGLHCGGYHGLPAVHLTYVGHAGITTRLNETVGPDGWSWEPLHVEPPAWCAPVVAGLIAAGEADKAMALIKEHGQPVQRDGGMWIRLTINGVSKIGFGDSQGKTGPNATKELIGDALRNAAMRFGVGTYLWSKSDRAKALAARHGADDEQEPERQGPLPEQVQSAIETAAASDRPVDRLMSVGNHYGRTNLERLEVADANGVAVTAAALIDQLIDRERAKQVQDQQAEQPAEQAEQPAEQQPEVQEPAAEHPAKQAADQAITAPQQQNDALAARRLECMTREVQEQATILGITPQEHVADLVRQHGVEKVRDVPPIALMNHVVGARPQAIAALRAAGRVQQAEVYESAGRSVTEWERLIGEPLPA